MSPGPPPFELSETSLMRDHQLDDDQLREPVVVYIGDDYQPPRLCTVRRVLEAG